MGDVVRGRVMFVTNRFRWFLCLTLATLVLAACVGDNGTPAADRPETAAPIRVAASNVILKDGTDEPKVVIELYEDFLCPACRRFEQDFGVPIAESIYNGLAAVDYYMVLPVIERDDVVVIGGDDDGSMRTAPLGVLSGAVVVSVTGSSPR